MIRFQIYLTSGLSELELLLSPKITFLVDFKYKLLMFNQKLKPLGLWFNGKSVSHDVWIRCTSRI